MKRSNIVLIGMPGSGKSTVGVLLAKLLAMRFIDTDILIQNHCGRTLQDIVDNEGHMYLREVEEQVILDVKLNHHVIATGGSVPYSEEGMGHLRENGIVVFLETDMPTLRARVHNYDSRGIARRPDQSIEDLFVERAALYKKYAEITVDCRHCNQDEAAEEIAHRVVAFFSREK
jgi:shikimate kinase